MGYPKRDNPAPRVKAPEDAATQRRRLQREAAWAHDAMAELMAEWSREEGFADRASVYRSEATRYRGMARNAQAASKEQETNRR